MTSSRWIELAGAANVRDLGGLPTYDGRLTRPGRLIRADNLQGLTAADVRTLVDEHGVRSVADLRTSIEVDAEGPGPMTREPGVSIDHLSLFPEAGRNTDAGSLDEDAPIVLPWQERRTDLSDHPRKGAASVYLGYLEDRADSAIAALRLVASSPGATIVHCAAGKDRTGVVVALALADVGVTREAIVEDYALSADRIGAIFGRLRSSSTYADDLKTASIDKQSPRPETMRRLLDCIEEQHGSVSAWLRMHGWSAADAEALRARLLD